MTQEFASTASGENSALREEWGNSPEMSMLLVGRFESLKDIPDLETRLKISQVFSNMLYGPLKDDPSFSEEDIENIQFNITSLKSDEQDQVPSDPLLLKVRDQLLEKYGRQVVRRINISLASDNEI